MKIWEVVLVSTGLSLQAFMAACSKGANQCELKKKTVLCISLIFGIVEIIMLAAGMVLIHFPMKGIRIGQINSLNLWFCAIILFGLGIRIIRTNFKKRDERERRENIQYKSITKLAVHTSIDTILLGVALELLNTVLSHNLMMLIILFITVVILTALGLWVGYRVGNKYRALVMWISAGLLIVTGGHVILDYFQSL